MRNGYMCQEWTALHSLLWARRPPKRITIHLSSQGFKVCHQLTLDNALVFKNEHVLAGMSNFVFESTYPVSRLTSLFHEVLFTWLHPAPPATRFHSWKCTLVNSDVLLLQLPRLPLLPQNHPTPPLLLSLLLLLLIFLLLVAVPALVLLVLPVLRTH